MVKYHIPLIVKNVIKNQKFNFPDKLCDICTKKMLGNKIVRFKEIYKFYFDHFLIKCTVFVIIVINTIKNQKLNFLVKLYGVWKNVTNVYEKSSAKRENRDENVFLKVDRAWSKWITLLISYKKEFNHFFKSRSSDIIRL